MKSFNAVKRGIKAAMAKYPQSFQAGGKIIVCSHCGGQSFSTCDLAKCLTEGLVREHYGLECAACSHIELFGKQPLENTN